MDILLALYPVELTVAIIGTFIVIFLKGFSVWRARGKARETYSNADEIYRIIAIVTPFTFLFLSVDVTMYHLGADLSNHRLESTFSYFLLAMNLSIYFGFVVPHIFRIDYEKLSSINHSLRVVLLGMLVFGLAALVVGVTDSLAESIFDKYAPCVLDIS